MPNLGGLIKPLGILIVQDGEDVKPADFKGLQRLQQVAGQRFMGGVVLYDGEMSIRFAEKLFAVPLRWLWESP